MKIKRNKKQGISLIVLVITIIVMLILTGVVMITLGNSNIIDFANDAATSHKETHEREKSLLEQIDELFNKAPIGSGESDLKKVTWVENDDGTLTASDGTIISVGDYVDYSPEGTPYVTKYTFKEGNTTVDALQSKYSGYDTDQVVYLQPIKWRVLGAKADGNLELISDKEVYIGNTSENTDKLYLKGATGYNNGVEIFNDICDKLYGSSIYAAEARSINIEDIQDKMDTSVWDWRNYTNTIPTPSLKYGETKKYEVDCAYYPARWKQEENGVVNGISTNGTLKLSDKGDLIPWNTEENAIGEKKGLTYFPEDENKAGTNITITQTGWAYQKLHVTNFKNPKHYNLLIVDENYHNYDSWIASRQNTPADLYSYFGFSIVHNGGVYINTVFWSNDGHRSSSCGIRPIISVSTSFSLSGSGENIGSVDNMWTISQNSK